MNVSEPALISLGIVPSSSGPIVVTLTDSTPCLALDVDALSRSVAQGSQLPTTVGFPRGTPPFMFPFMRRTDDEGTVPG